MNPGTLCSFYNTGQARNKNVFKNIGKDDIVVSDERIHETFARTDVATINFTESPAPFLFINGGRLLIKEHLTYVHICLHNSTFCH